MLRGLGRQQERLRDVSQCPPPTPLLLSSGVLSSAREAMWCVPVSPAYFCHLAFCLQQEMLCDASRCPHPSSSYQAFCHQQVRLYMFQCPTSPYTHTIVRRSVFSKWGYETCSIAPLHTPAPAWSVLYSVSHIFFIVPVSPLPPPPLRHRRQLCLQ